MLLISAICSTILALILYTVAVWTERHAGSLKVFHVVLLWDGLVFDILGTVLMATVAGGFALNAHGILGGLAILLMLALTIWGTFGLAAHREKIVKNFHHAGLIVWAVWLLSFLTGMALGMAR